MAEKTYIVMFKAPELKPFQTVVASTAEVHDEHLVFCESNGELTALENRPLCIRSAFGVRSPCKASQVPGAGSCRA